MTKSRAGQERSRRGEIVIAIIGLGSVFVTGFLSNWDKIFPKQNVVQAAYSGYRPTGNFETELRYFFDVSGTRTALESMEQQVLQNARVQALSKNPEDTEEINKVFDAIREEAIRLDDVIREFLPIYQKHFAINEIQELNKFYSTDVMQSMAKKGPLVAQDAAPIQVKLMDDYFQRVEARISAETKGKK